MLTVLQLQSVRFRDAKVVRLLLFYQFTTTDRHRTTWCIYTTVYKS